MSTYSFNNDPEDDFTNNDLIIAILLTIILSLVLYNIN